MPRAKIPDGELVHFIVKARYHANQTSEFQKNLTLVRNMVNRMFRDHVGYTLAGHHRLKAKGEAVFAAESVRDKKRAPREGRAPDVKVFLRYLGDGAFLLEGSRTLVLGVPSSTLQSVSKIDYVLADRFTPAMRENLIELLKSSKATLVGLPEVTAEGSLRGLSTRDLHVGGSFSEEGLAVHGVVALSTEGLSPLGYVVEMDGAVVYHAGRSALTTDMQLVGDLFKVDAMTLPVGKSVPMSPWAATQAVEWVAPKFVLPWAAEEGVYVKELQKHVGDMARVKVLGANERWEVE